MAVRKAKTDNGRWFELSDGRIEKCTQESASSMWPDMFFLPAGSAFQALEKRALQLIRLYGRYGRFDTVAYCKIGKFEFERFSRRDDGRVVYSFRDMQTGVLVPKLELTAEEVESLHEVITDSLDALQYDSVCRGMNSQAGIGDGSKLSGKHFCELLQRGAVEQDKEKFAVRAALGEECVAHGSYVYAVGELYREVPDITAVVSFLTESKVPLDDVFRAAARLREASLDDSWCDRFKSAYGAYLKRLRQKNENFLIAIAGMDGRLVTERNAGIILKALAEYNDEGYGLGMKFPSRFHLCHEHVGGGDDGSEYAREVFIESMYLKEDGGLYCDVVGDDGWRGSSLRLSDMVSLKDFVGSLQWSPDLLKPLELEEGSYGLYVKFGQMMKARILAERKMTGGEDCREVMANLNHVRGMEKKGYRYGI